MLSGKTGLVALAIDKDVCRGWENWGVSVLLSLFAEFWYRRSTYAPCGETLAS